MKKTKTSNVVLNRTTVQLRMSNKRFGLIKGMSIDGKETYEIAVNERGQQVDIDAILREDKRAYLKKYGKISPTLYNKMAKNRPGERLPVVLWLAVDEEKVDKSEFDDQQLQRVPQSLLNYRQQNQEAQSNLRTLLGQKLQIEVQAESDVVPALYLELTPSQIQKLNRWDEVGGLFLHETEGFDDLADSMAISNADDVVNTLGFDGTGSRVCVWEGGPDVLTNLVISDHYTTPWPGDSWHARLVTGIIRNSESGGAPNGYAPNATVYSGNSYDPNNIYDVAALDWCVNSPQRSRIINQSFHYWSEQYNGDLSANDLHKDYMAVHYPYPTIVQAAGNGPSSEFVNHKGFNSLTVGSHNDTATTMSGFSVSLNPNSPHGDRELPELAANGEDVTAVGRTANGTSFSSPAVAGTVALLHEANTTLRSWPEGNRAVLLAGATQNVSGNTWQQDVSAGVDARDGSGALNAEESVQIALNRISINNSASTRGWNVGTLVDSSFGSGEHPESTFSYHIQVPSTGGNHVKVALAWNSEVTNSPATSELVIDMDILVYDGSSIVARSASWDNSYEIAEFNGVAGRTYTVKLRRWSGAGEQTFYGLAWSVH